MELSSGLAIYVGVFIPTYFMILGDKELSRVDIG